MATKSAAKKSAGKKSTAKKAAARKSTAKKTAATKSAAKGARKSAAAKKSGAPRRGAVKGGGKSAAKGAGNYTKPALRERLKNKIMAGTKGGRAGQWSARKAQLLSHEYEAQGGGYSGKKTAGQKHLGSWTKEKWQTADGKPAARGKTTARYLPKKAWDKLSPAERRATDEKKRAGSKRGKQFVGNTKRAAAARKSAGKRTAAKRSTAKKSTAKRSSAKKSAAKKSTAKRSS